MITIFEGMEILKKGGFEFFYRSKISQYHINKSKYRQRLPQNAEQRLVRNKKGFGSDITQHSYICVQVPVLQPAS